MRLLFLLPFRRAVWEVRLSHPQRGLQLREVATRRRASAVQAAQAKARRYGDEYIDGWIVIGARRLAKPLYPGI